MRLASAYSLPAPPSRCSPGITIAALLVGCATEVGQPDLSARMEDIGASIVDQSVADQKRAATDLPYDFCAQLTATLAGAPPANCAVAFYRDFLACFHRSGHCHFIELDGFGAAQTTYCWDDGSDTGSHEVLDYYSTTAVNPDGTVCARYAGSKDVSSGQFCLENTADSCASNNNAELSPTDGSFTCPDGTRVTIGPFSQRCMQTLQSVMDPATWCDEDGSTFTCAVSPL